jgi:hypothetical protein
MAEKLVGNWEVGDFEEVFFDSMMDVEIDQGLI